MELTEEQFFEKYGDVKVKFHYYYKYTFYYVGKLPNGNKITVGLGGSADDIYKCKVSFDDEDTVQYINPHFGQIFDNEGKVIDEFYE
jgi:hypothetical protein